jgi:methyl-accepting chemotaxis protein
MKRIRDVSIRQKLTGTILVVTLSVLMLACLALAIQEINSYRSTMEQDMTVLADLLAGSSAVALDLDQDASAAEKLGGLVADRHIVCAVLYRNNGNKFAHYLRAGAATSLLPDHLPPVEAAFDPDSFRLTRPVLLNGKKVGSIFLRADLDGMYERIRSYAVIVGVIVTVALAVTFGLSYGLQRLISRPILDLAGTARIVADRKDYSVRAKRQGRDEIGLLTDAFNQMLAEIETGQAALRQTVGVLGSSSREILALSAQVASSATQTATSLSETTATVEEVRHTALVSSQKTREVSESAQRVRQISEVGKRSTEETIAGISRIREQMESIAQSMVRLTEQTRTISDIITSVEDLAQQSNLLAVNAAIEAAKAGEQGKGFSVVALEVRNLAEQSRGATAQVRGILGDVQRATGGAVMATEQGTRAVEAGVRQSEQAGDSILSLAAAVSEAAQAAAQIAASSQQQLAGMDQVAAAMESIKKASGQNVDSARELEVSARSLEQVGQRLSELVGRQTQEPAPGGPRSQATA